MGSESGLVECRRLCNYHSFHNEERRELTHFKNFEFEYFPVNAKVEETSITDKAFDELD